MAEAKIVFTPSEGLATEVLFDREIDARKFIQRITSREFRRVHLEYFEGRKDCSIHDIKTLSENAA